MTASPLTARPRRHPPQAEGPSGRGPLLSRLRDFARLVRVEDWATFLQLVAGFGLARQAWHPADAFSLLRALLILAPCIYGGLYALNDAHDAPADRLHPVKRTRPVAAGRITARQARRLGWGLIGLGLVLALSLDHKVLALALGFLGLNLLYTYWLKRVPYVEIVLNTVTHPLRFAAGAWLAGGGLHGPLLALWLFAVGALTLLKRVKEMREAPLGARPVLRHYRERHLKRLIAVCLGLVLGLWLSTRGLAFLAGGLWAALLLVSVIGYFRVPMIRRLVTHLWR